MEEEEHGDGESHNEFTDEDASFLVSMTNKKNSVVVKNQTGTC
jgi:hypothetical protein